MTDIVSINPAMIGKDFLQRILFSLFGIDLAVNTLLYAITANTHGTNSKLPLYYLYCLTYRIDVDNYL